MGIESGVIASPDQMARLYGHLEAETALASACQSGRLHHSLLIGGPRGIGKATLAFRLARYLLKGAAPVSDLLGATDAPNLQIPEDDPVFRQVAAGAHRSLRVVERQRNSDTGRLARDISVDSIRSLSEFFRLTSGDGSWRIAIIDGAEEMNQNAANALLKLLEEPPERSLIILVSHAPGRLLPTIRSRCYALQLGPLPDAVLREALASNGIAADDELDTLVELSEGSLGNALAISRIGGVELYRDIRVLMAQQADRPLSAELDTFSDRLARVGQEETFDMFTRMMEGEILRTAIDLARDSPQSAKPDLDRWVEVWEKVRALFAQANGLGLDRKHVIQNAFLHVSEAARRRAIG